MNFTYQYNGQTYIVELDAQPDGSFQATIGGKTFAVQTRPVTQGGWILDAAGAPSLVYTAQHGSDRYISVGGETYTLVVPEARGARRRFGGAEGGAQLTAQMPGQVIDVRVAEGDRVEKGQTLVILEAMKMEIRVAAPYSGQVRRLAVSVGALVERGQALVELEPDKTA